MEASEYRLWKDRRRTEMDNSNDRNPIADAKEKCREEAKRILKEAGEGYCSDASGTISLNLLGMPEMKKAYNVLIYFSVGSEPGTLAVIDRLFRTSKKVCLPLCTDLDEKGQRSGDLYAMEARIIKSFDDLEPGAYGIPEPKAETELMPPGKLDLIVLPCVACDRKFRRIGHGAGYYDKYLSMAGRDCFTVALCYEKLLFDEIPAEDHDMPVDAIVTEETVYRWRG